MPIAVGQVVLLKLCAFAINRENGKGKVVKDWLLGKTELSGKRTLADFLITNISTVLSMQEMRSIRGSASSPSVLILKTQPRRSRAKAYVLQIDTASRILSNLEGVRKAQDLQTFKANAVALRNSFMESLQWPRCYLFVAQVEVSTATFADHATVTMTARLRTDPLAEDPVDILEHLKQAILEDRVRKTAVYPYLDLGKQIASPNFAKVHEMSQRPARYFYESMGIIPPMDPTRETVERITAHAMSSPPKMTLSTLVPKLDGRALQDFKDSRMSIKIGDIGFSAPLGLLGKKVFIVRMADGSHAVLVKGDPMEVMVGKRDLLGQEDIGIIDIADLAA